MTDLDADRERLAMMEQHLQELTADIGELQHSTDPSDLDLLRRCRAQSKKLTRACEHLRKRRR